MDVSTDRKTIYTGGSDGTVTAWNSESGKSERVAGTGHGAQIIQLKSELIFNKVFRDEICWIGATIYMLSHHPESGSARYTVPDASRV